MKKGLAIAALLVALSAASVTAANAQIFFGGDDGLGVGLNIGGLGLGVGLGGFGGYPVDYGYGGYGYGYPMWGW